MASKKITMICLEDGSISKVSESRARLAQEIDQLSLEDQARFLKLVRSIKADAPPSDLRKMLAWTREDFRARMDALP